MAHDGSKDKSHAKSGQSHPSAKGKPTEVVVVPNDKLVFSLSAEGDHEGKAKAHVVIHNPTDKEIIFKFKSNATGSVTVGVHPSGGHVLPGEHADINVILDYDTEEHVKDLKVLIVTANAPGGEIDLKTVWNDIEDDQKKTTKVVCVVSTDPNSQHKSCFISKAPSHAPSTGSKPPAPSSGSKHQAPSSGSKPPPHSSNHKEKSPKPDSGPAPASKHQSSQHEGGHMSQQHDPLPKASMFAGYQPQQQQQQQQQQPSRNMPMDGGNRQGTQQMNQDNPAHQGRKPTSYFVDVSSVAAPGSNSAGVSTSGFFGMDTKSLMQGALLIAAGAAATKLFFE